MARSVFTNTVEEGEASDNPDQQTGEISYTAVLLSQGKHRFYTLAMPSQVLAETCMVDPRVENPIDGFQRLLDKKRAQEIADYIDNGFGTIPGSIVLSAQPEAKLRYIRKARTINFQHTPRSFLIIDGQHRVYGFKLAKEPLRVPVVIYNGLSRSDEARLFMDINTKQRPVPPELILDIKRLADTETDVEALLRDAFDAFNTNADSRLLGLLSPSEKQKGKLSRVTFNVAMRSVWNALADSDSQSVYEVFSAYLQAFMSGLRTHAAAHNITNPTMFRAATLAFPDVAQRVSDRFDGDYSAANFERVLSPLFRNVKKGRSSEAGRKPCCTVRSVPSGDQCWVLSRKDCCLVSILADALQPFFVAGLNTVEGRAADLTLADLIGGQTRHGFDLDFDTATRRIVTDFREPHAILRATAADASRFASAAFQSIEHVPDVIADREHTAWSLIKAYYSAFYAGHAIIRLTGESCSYFQASHVNRLRDLGVIYGKMPGFPLPASAYHCVIDAISDCHSKLYPS